MNTHGSVTIEDGNPGEPGDFNPRRKVSVTFSFDADNGEDGQKFLDDAASMADRKVDELLGRKVKAVVKTETAKAPETKTEKPAKAEKKTKAAEKTKADIEAEYVAELEKAKTTPAPTLEEGDDEPEVDPDELGDLLGSAAPAPITDAELAKAAQVKAATLKAANPDTYKPTAIRELIVAYAGQPPKKITDIPVAKRQEFLDKLKALS